MRCPSCGFDGEQLEDRIATLEDQALVASHEFSVLSTKHGLSLNEAWVMYRLYLANGRPVSYYVLHEDRPLKLTQNEDGYEKTISVVVHRIRRKLSVNVIQTVHGQGYAISHEGLALVKASLQPFS